MQYVYVGKPAQSRRRSGKAPAVVTGCARQTSWGDSAVGGTRNQLTGQLPVGIGPRVGGRVFGNGLCSH